MITIAVNGREKQFPDATTVEEAVRAAAEHGA